MSENNRAGFAAIIGRPNVGKSTLMNQLIGQKIAITSARPQTTRDQIRTVYTDERGQIVFLDTPGMIRETRNKLGQYMRKVSTGTLADADVILYLIEPSAYIGAGDAELVEMISASKRPVILVINKIDTIQKDMLLPIIDAYRKVLNVEDIIPVSALKGLGVAELADTIFKYMPEGPNFYDEDTVTDQPIRAIAAEIVREKALQLLNDEIPHGIAVMIDTMSQREDKPLMDVEATIICEKDSHKGIIIGKGGSMLKKISTAARYEIEQLVEEKVYLRLFVKVRRDWRDSDTQLRNFGYHQK
ncbi:MAG: GTPase Era [Lachnospiraceae bacterium]|nr:GTPase Era [Candidatus Equihabitans merdae]